MFRKLWVLGTASAYPSLRYKSSFLLEFDSGTYLLDCGVPAGEFLARGFDFLNIKGILISHLHIDHILYLLDYFQSLKLLGREEELIIYGPDNLSRVLDECFPAFFIYPENLPYKIKVKKYRETTSLLKNIVVFSNRHLKKSKYLDAKSKYDGISLESYSFFINSDEQSFFISGDLKDEEDLYLVLKELYSHLKYRETKDLESETTPNKENRSLDDNAREYNEECVKKHILELLIGISDFSDCTYILDGSHIAEATLKIFTTASVPFYITHYQNKQPSLKQHYYRRFYLSFR